MVTQGNTEQKRGYKRQDRVPQSKTGEHRVTQRNTEEKRKKRVKQGNTG